VNPASFPELFTAGNDPPGRPSRRPASADHGRAFDEKIATTAPANIRKYAIVATGDKAIARPPNVSWHSAPAR